MRNGQAVRGLTLALLGTTGHELAALLRGGDKVPPTSETPALISQNQSIHMYLHFDPDLISAFRYRVRMSVVSQLQVIDFNNKKYPNA